MSMTLMDGNQYWNEMSKIEWRFIISLFKKIYAY